MHNILLFCKYNAKKPDNISADIFLLFIFQYFKFIYFNIRSQLELHSSATLLLDYFFKFLYASHFYLLIFCFLLFLNFNNSFFNIIYVIMFLLFRLFWTIYVSIQYFIRQYIHLSINYPFLWNFFLRLFHPFFFPFQLNCYYFCLHSVILRLIIAELPRQYYCYYNYYAYHYIVTVSCNNCDQ